MTDVQPSPAPKRLPELVDYGELVAELGVSRRTIERMVRVGKFPAPFPLTENSVRWELKTVNTWLEERKRGLAARAVESPDQIAPEQIAPALRELGARLISEQIGEDVSPERVRLLIQQTPTNEDLTQRRGQLLSKVEKLFEHFGYWRALLVAMALFPAIRERFTEEVGPNMDPDRLRELAIASIDDEWWDELENLEATSGIDGRVPLTEIASDGGDQPPILKP